MSDFIETLIRTYRNEKHTKQLLPYNKRLMEFTKRALPKQIEYAESLKGFNILKTIIDQEIETIKYYTNEYLVIRMEKMNKNFFLDQTLLSDFENEYYESVLNLYKAEDVFVEEQVNDENEFVGFISLVDNKNVVLDMEAVVLMFGDFFVAPLRDVIDLLLKNEIYLI